MTSSKRLVFFGNERLVSGLKQTNAPILRGLIERGYNVVAVVANHADTESRNARELEVRVVANEHGIPVFTPEKPTDIFDELVSLHPDAAILSAYGKILPKRIIDVFEPIGIINIHPSLLPRHRGPTPIETTILNGDTEAGVSIMRLSTGMDDGPLFGQTSFAIPTDITKFELYEKLSAAGAELLFSLLKRILDGSLTPQQQENNGVSFTTLISKQDGIIDPKTDTATNLERKIRAFQGYPKPKLHINDTVVIVTTSTVVQNDSPTDVCVKCAGSTWLRVDCLVAPSGRTMTGADFLRGYGKTLN